MPWHKTKKLSFRVVFWMTVFFNISVIYSIHTPTGAKLVRYSLHNIEQLLVAEVHLDKAREVMLVLTNIE